MLPGNEVNLKKVSIVVKMAREKKLLEVVQDNFEDQQIIFNHEKLVGLEYGQTRQDTEDEKRKNQQITNLGNAFVNYKMQLHSNQPVKEIHLDDPSIY